MMALKKVKRKVVAQHSKSALKVKEIFFLYFDVQLRKKKVYVKILWTVRRWKELLKGFYGKSQYWKILEN